MTKQKAIEIIGPHRPIWELRNMAKALSFFPWLNTDAENERLEACKVLLKAKRLK